MVRREDKKENSRIEEVAKALESAGAVSENPPQHAIYRFRLGDGIVTIYKSGSIVYGGKGDDKEILKSIVDSVLTENVDITPRIGCDEAGKGEYAGPLVVACIYCDEPAVKELIKLGVKDSKKLSDEKVLRLADEIKKVAHGAVRVLMPQEYNRLYANYKNINRLLDVVYLSLIDKLVKKYKPKRVIVDKYGSGIKKKLCDNLPDSVDIVVVEKAESDPVVAAASIVARAEKLKGCQLLEKKFGVKIPSGNNKDQISHFLQSVSENMLPYLVKMHFNMNV
ncbi:ribonuclease HIII [Desulfurobacterium indicum]|uniref:Ribonuclease n=1 Tax=Desulfurobacterium indicum TaxID=1914305 RepID=A0A1R1MNG5_9BACT|nr:ribonuclease HIII [Desulfurobacterium indicum]OMH41303.1 ribonuclease HIII [Desulfurobacterium indicum]